MNTSEFSVAFDVYYNNITSNQAPGLNEYEKSMFLTQAQNQLVREYFNSRIDQAGGGYDGNEKRQYDFSCLTKHSVLETVNAEDKFDQRALVYKLPDDWFLTINEQVTVNNPTNGSKYITVYPISLQEYDRLMSKPYKYPNKNQVWRLITEHVYERITPTPEPVYASYYYKWNFLPDQDEDACDMGVKINNISCPPYYISVMASDKVSVISTDTTTESAVITVPLNMTGSIMNRGIQIAIPNILSELTPFDFSVFAYVNERVTDLTLEELNFCDGQQIFGIYLPGTTERPQSDDTVYTLPSIEIILNSNDYNSNTDTLTYRMRYVKKPKPIILENLTNYNVSIDGLTAVTECELPEVTHKEILERAVVLAKSMWVANTQQQNNQRERSDR